MFLNSVKTINSIKQTFLWLCVKCKKHFHPFRTFVYSRAEIYRLKIVMRIPQRCPVGWVMNEYFHMTCGGQEYVKIRTSHSNVIVSDVRRITSFGLCETFCWWSDVICEYFSMNQNIKVPLQNPQIVCFVALQYVLYSKRRK